jgi:hypothetical protein
MVFSQSVAEVYLFSKVSRLGQDVDKDEPHSVFATLAYMKH